MLPNFLVVGAEKAGTTTLAALLSQHPDIFMCEPKEPRFFSYHNWAKGLAWYESLFEGAAGYKAVGEASPTYTWAPHDPAPPRRIYDCLGTIKYVYIVRHPIKRMISHYRHGLFWRWFPDNTTFEESYRRIPGIKDCSRYFYQIQQYLPYSHRDQWFILVLQELIDQPARVQRALYRFLEVDHQFVTTLPSENVMDQKVRLPTWLPHIMPLKQIIPAPIYQSVKSYARQLIGRKIERPVIPPQLTANLAQEFEPEAQALSAFAGRDFTSIWSLDRSDRYYS